ncbi:MAG: hypothetical protein MUF18_16890 [Fimbriiglobus sp.]|nr:hypothetical protein [Fimbriiglobus sp.]
MPVVVCPNCRAELELDADDIGHRVECPGCLAVFLATPPAPKPPPDPEPPPLPDPEPPPPPTAEPPPPPPPERPDDRPSRRSGESVVLSCPACQGKVSVVADDLGHRVECPMCAQVFRADDPDRPPPSRSSRRDDDRPTRRRSRDDDDEDDDRPRRRRRRRLDDDGYENPYQSPDPKAWVWAARRDLTTPGAGLEVLGWIDVALGVLGLIIGVGFAVSDPNAITGGPNAFFFWGNLGPGISGVVIGAVKAMGGRQMKQVKNRPLSIAACVAGCVPLNVSCCMSSLAFPAYIVGIVFGIMGLTKLLNAGVKKAFEANRPGGDIDTV